ncbi:hypothetical protein ACJX0J_017129, partial [Zea mays]
NWEAMNVVARPWSLPCGHHRRLWPSGVVDWVLRSIMLRRLFGRRIPILPFSETVAGFLKLVELYKGLI